MVKSGQTRLLLPRLCGFPRRTLLQEMYHVLLTFDFVCMKSIYLNLQKLRYGSNVLDFLSHVLSNSVNVVNDINGYSRVQPSLRF